MIVIILFLRNKLEICAQYFFLAFYNRQIVFIKIFTLLLKQNLISASL